MKRLLCWCVGVLVCWCASALVGGCVPTPVVEPGEPVVITAGGTYVVCEGLWQQDNAVMSYLTPTNTAVRDAVSAVNPGTKLGDTASDILRVGDSLYIVVSTSRKIFVIDAATANVSSTVSMPNSTPYHVATDGDDRMYVTNLGDDSITELRTDPLQVSVPRVPVGPAPDGICVLRNAVYVALSGLGDLRKNEQGAGTITVLRTSDLRVIDTIGNVPNVGELLADAQRDRVWGVYRHFISQPDSLGGVVLINGTTQDIESTWRFHSPSDLTINPTTGKIYVLHGDGIDEIDPVQALSRRLVDHHSGDGADVWYSIGFDGRTGNLLVGNARSYVTDGEVIEISTDGSVRSRRPVGVNPTAFAY